MLTELHCHTTASDGLLGPTALVELAHSRGIGVLAITDHDTFAANAEAAHAGETFGVRVIPGIEVSSLATAGEVHVLGYGIAPTDPRTLDKLASLRGVRESRARGILANLDRLGIHIDFDEVRALAGDGMIGRPHVARAMVKAGVVVTQQQAFDEYLAEGKPAFMRHDGLSPAQAVQLIHDANSIAVLAHPSLFRGELDALLDDMLAAGLDGIETYYPWHTPEQIQHYERIAREHNLVRTGGSDFHGVYGDREITLGSMHVPDECLADLDARIAARRGSGKLTKENTDRTEAAEEKKEIRD